MKEPEIDRGLERVMAEGRGGDLGRRKRAVSSDACSSTQSEFCPRW